MNCRTLPQLRSPAVSAAGRILDQPTRTAGPPTTGASVMARVTLDAADAGELAEMLPFVGECLARDPPAGSLARGLHRPPRVRHSAPSRPPGPPHHAPPRQRRRAGP